MPVTTKNYYPELPEVPYKKTSIAMSSVLAFAKSLVPMYGVDYVRMAYAVFRMESANGTKGVNNNYAGIQADNARWTGLPGTPIATCVRKDVAGNTRRFLCFGEDGYKISFELICIKARDRKMVTAMDYENKWVGIKNPSAAALKTFNSLLSTATKLIPA